jgi:Ca2+-binding RTX toxin-like protein
MSRRISKLFSFRAKQKKHRTSARRSSQFGFESLETRQVMAANLTAALVGDVLNIEGTPGNDTINVRYDGATVRVDGISIVQNGAAAVSVPISAVRTINVSALAGNDTVKMFETAPPNSRAIHMTVNGGWGNDAIEGGSGNDNLYGNQRGDASATVFDRDLGLYIAPEGIYYNSGGKQEKWMLSKSGAWHFITPDGSLYKQTQSGYAIGNKVVQLDPSFYNDPATLCDADSGATAATLDRGLGLYSTGNLYQNSAGRNEKWLMGASGWHFITPDGTLIRQMQIGNASYDIAFCTLDPSYWKDVSKLTEASTRFTDQDVVFGNYGVDVIGGGADVDRLVGGAGGDILNGNEGDDVMWGGWENNAHISYDDADRIYGDAGNDQAHGGGGIDQLWGDVGRDALWGDDDNDYLYGGTEADELIGGAGADNLWGGYGGDALYGGVGNDRLYGQMDYDRLYGEAGNDWLDAGSAGEHVDGGVNTDGTPERDINAFITSPNGAQFGDLDQGASQTCWIVAAMGAVSRYEDLSQRITYLGDNLYAVRLYQRVDNMSIGAFKSQTEYVRFDGSRLSSDPDPNSTEGETWMIIMQRAIIQAIAKFDPSQNLTNPHSGGVLDPLSILTGRWGKSVLAASVGSTQALADLVSSGKMVAAHTLNIGTTTLIANHVYTVLGRSGDNVLLYNPWGSFVTVSWAAFARDCGSICYV